MRNKDEASTQTQPIAFFRVKRSDNQKSKGIKSEKPTKTRVKREIQKINVEDYILDSILKDRLIYGKSSITNTWMADIFTKNPEPFRISSDNEFSTADNDWQMFKRFLVDQGHSGYLTSLEKAFKEVLLHNSIYFNMFNKYTKASKKSIYQSMAIFIIWLSKYLKHKITLYLFYVVSMFVYVIWTKNHFEDEIKQYLIDNFTGNENLSDIAETEQLFYTIFGSSKISYMEFRTVIQYLIDYFAGNGLLSDK